MLKGTEDRLVTHREVIPYWSNFIPGLIIQRRWDGLYCLEAIHNSSIICLKHRALSCKFGLFCYFGHVSDHADLSRRKCRQRVPDSSLFWATTVSGCIMMFLAIRHHFNQVEGKLIKTRIGASFYKHGGFFRPK